MRQYTYSFNSDRSKITITTPNGSTYTRTMPSDAFPGVVEEEQARDAIRDLMFQEYNANGFSETLLEYIADLSTARLDDQ